MTWNLINYYLIIKKALRKARIIASRFEKHNKTLHQIIRIKAYK